MYNYRRLTSGYITIPLSMEVNSMHGWYTYADFFSLDARTDKQITGRPL